MHQLPDAFPHLKDWLPDFFSRQPRSETAMSPPDAPHPEQDSSQAAAHVASARQILKALQTKIGEHPELGEAITKLEMALNDLAIQTGGML